VVGDQVLSLIHFLHQLAHGEVASRKLLGKSPADVMGKERNNFRGRYGRFQTMTIISRWLDVFLVWGQRLLHPPLASTSTPLSSATSRRPGVQPSDHFSSHNAGFAKLVIRRLESARRSCQRSCQIHLKNSIDTRRSSHNLSWQLMVAGRSLHNANRIHVVGATITLSRSDSRAAGPHIREGGQSGLGDAG